MKQKHKWVETRKYLPHTESTQRAYFVAYVNNILFYIMFYFFPHFLFIWIQRVKIFQYFRYFVISLVLHKLIKTSHSHLPALQNPSLNNVFTRPMSLLYPNRCTPRPNIIPHLQYHNTDTEWAKCELNNPCIRNIILYSSLNLFFACINSPC
jgi:hypothetical protein